MSNNNEVDYSLPRLGLFKWIMFLGATFVITLFIYFPIISRIDSTLRSQLSSNPSCKINFRDYKIELFSPKIRILGLNIPRRCLKQSGKDIESKVSTIYFRGFSFSPLGPHFRLETDILSKPLIVNITLGISTIAIHLNEQVINLKDLTMLNASINLQGKLTVNALVKMSKQKIEEFRIHTFSKDIVSNPLSISGFKLKRLPLNNLLLKASNAAKSKIKVEELILGDENAPIRANFSGSIDPNYKSMPSSQLDMSGELAFSEGFLKDYSIISLLMNKFDKKDDFYQININGTFAQPNAESPRK